jgi:bifunctional oligoribonuclease and PAP phosphatase NrnA
MKPLHEAYDLLRNQPGKTAIIMHQKPDADAMGSTLALSMFLRRLGHETLVISPTNWAHYLNWMTGAKEVLDYDRSVAKVETLLSQCSLVFCLDFNHFGRTRKMQPFLTQLPVTKILIDHHQEPQAEAFGYGNSDTGKSSTCEMVYDFITDMGEAAAITPEMAQCLYAGVMTDTGSFRFPSTTASVHAMVAALMQTGFNHAAVHDELFDNYYENRLRFIGHVLSNCMEVFYEYNTVLIAVPYSDLVKYDIKTGDTEGVVNYPQSISGIRMVAIIIDRGDEIKLSFRSKGNVDVNTFARKYFNGGGHFHASGGSSKENLQNTIRHFIKAMEESGDILQ